MSLFRHIAVMSGFFAAVSARAQDHTLNFNTSDPGVTKSIETWGMDVTWASPDNMRSALINMGSDQIDVVRVGYLQARLFQPGEPVAREKPWQALKQRLEQAELF